jgi:PIN domain nuclease of toxin-antitoxin system
MRLLLDTHVFLWFISADGKLPSNWRDAIRDPENQVYLSVVSLWETIIKNAIGKLPLPERPETYIPKHRARHQIESFPLDERSVSHLADLPAIHKDPFDRMLVCQAIEHDLTVMTVDEVFERYPAQVFK